MAFAVRIKGIRLVPSNVASNLYRTPAQSQRHRKPATIPVRALLSASFHWLDIESHVAQTGIDQIHRICSVVDTKPGSIRRDTYL